MTAVKMDVLAPSVPLLIWDKKKDFIN